MNPLHLLHRQRRGHRADERPLPSPRPVWVWKCTIHAVPNHEACAQVFDTAPELRRHYVRDHRMPPADVSLNRHQLMIRWRLTEGQEQEQPRYPSTREFVRSEDFDPRWPTGPIDDAYGPWMVSGRGEVGKGLREARERMFVPDWYYDEVSRRVSMARGRMWG